MILTLKKRANTNLILEEVKSLSGYISAEISELRSYERYMFGERQLAKMSTKCLVITCDDNDKSNKGWNAAAYAYQYIKGTADYILKSTRMKTVKVVVEEGPIHVRFDRDMNLIYAHGVREEIMVEADSFTRALNIAMRTISPAGRLMQVFYGDKEIRSNSDF